MNPLKPLMNGCSFQYWKPMGPCCSGTPPAVITFIRFSNKINTSHGLILPIKATIAISIQLNFIVDATTSTSAKNFTTQILTKIMTTQKMVIHAALGTSSVQ